MKQTKLIMGMPITVEVVDDTVTPNHLTDIFNYFRAVDRTFSTYKPESEISRLNRGELTLANASKDVQKIFELARQTKGETSGYFDIGRFPTCDPSGIVKGWAIDQAAQLLEHSQLHNFYIDAGGDVAARGHNGEGKKWRVGVRNPFNKHEIVKVIAINNGAIATSGTYERGQHIYNPKTGAPVTEIVSLTVIGPNIYDADRFATAAFAMGKDGIHFIEQLPGFEGYQIDANGVATMTREFEHYVAK